MRALVVLPVVLLCLTAPRGAAAAQAPSRLANAIAVIVNDAVITYADVEAFIAPAVEVLLRQYGNNPKVLEEKLMAVRRDGTEQLVERQLILADWEKSGFQLPDSVVEDEINDRIRSRYGDRLTLTKTLQAQGVTWEQFRKQVREDIIVGALRARHAGASSIIISPAKIEAYYAAHQDQFKMEPQVKLRMIVVNEKPDNPGGAKKLLEEVRARIVEGASFAEMASLYSEGSQRAEGGSWGWVERTVLREDLAEVAFQLKPGEVSQVLVTPAACYLMLVEEAKSQHVRPLAEVRDEIERLLVGEERARLQKKYVDKLRAQSFVRYF
jgi:peptidyl-prolyl cis-trans isomerase SurA